LSLLEKCAKRNPVDKKALKVERFDDGKVLHTDFLCFTKGKVHLHLQTEDKSFNVIAEPFDLQDARKALGGTLEIPVERSGHISVLWSSRSVAHPDWAMWHIDSGSDGFASVEEALEFAETEAKDVGHHVYIMVTETIHETPKVLHHIPPVNGLSDAQADEEDRRDADADRKERAVELGRGLGVDAYNEAMNFRP
jgi:hypothetical protein